MGKTLSLPIIISDAWLLPLLNIWCKTIPRPGQSGWEQVGKRKKILTRKVKGLGTRKNAQRPLTLRDSARRRRAEPSSRWLADIGSQMRQCRDSPARPTEVARAEQPFSGRSKAAGQIPPRPRPSIHLARKRRFSGGARGGEGKSKLWGLPTGV